MTEELREWDLREAYAYYKDGRTLVDVGRRYGIAPQTAHKRFCRAALARCNNKKWTLQEVDVLVRAYEEAGPGPVDLDTLATALERHKTNVCRKARELGYTNQARPHDPEAYAKSAQTHKLLNLMRLTPRRPALGHRHNEESRRKISEANRRRAADPSIPKRTMGEAQKKALSLSMSKRLAGTNVYSRAKRGRRPDLGDIFFRSSWEANYARYLNLLKSRGVVLSWDYEPETFWFEAVRRGARSYLPDFRVTTKDGTYYVEVKGWMDKKSKTKLKRMAKYYPKVDLRVVGKKEYCGIERQLAGAIPGWEHPGATVTVRAA